MASPTPRSQMPAGKVILGLLADQPDNGQRLAELMDRLALCRPSDMPRLIEVLREAELACTVRLEDLNACTREQERAADLQGWEAHLSVAAMTGTAAWWDARIRWLGDLRAGLQRAWLGYEAEQRGAASTRTRR
jgi:hypothetical protein